MLESASTTDPIHPSCLVRPNGCSVRNNTALDENGKKSVPDVKQLDVVGARMKFASKTDKRKEERKIRNNARSETLRDAFPVQLGKFIPKLQVH